MWAQALAKSFVGSGICCVQLMFDAAIWDSFCQYTPIATMTMKIIFSRKGFDSSAGGCASPILPDGRLLSLPIPEARGRHRMGQLLAGPALSVSRMVHQLSKGKVRHQTRIHLDPDLTHDALATRSHAWQAALGQHGAAQGHLRKQGVGVGDLFLFFGWFRCVQKSRGRWQYMPDAPDLHVLYGWLQVGTQLDASAPLPESFEGLSDHAHRDMPYRGENTLYVASKHLTLGDTPTGLAGAGCLPRFHDDLCLTRGERRGEWALPAWIWPSTGKKPLSYHERPERWSRSATGVHLDLVNRGQEFVLDTKDYPEAVSWAKELLIKHGGSTSIPT